MLLQVYGPRDIFNLGLVDFPMPPTPIKGTTFGIGQSFCGLFFAKRAFCVYHMLTGSLGRSKESIQILNFRWQRLCELCLVLMGGMGVHMKHTPFKDMGG